MAGGKWIENLCATTPSVDAARHALTVRFETVREGLEKTQTSTVDDPEAVHQLRVATRRARAALDLFDDCLPPKKARKVQKQLRKIRHAAGDVRDLDVFLIALATNQGGLGTRMRPALDLINGLALAQRETARAALRQASRRQPFAFERLANKATEAISRPMGKHAAQLGDRALPLLQKRMEALKESVDTSTNDLSQFHRTRIAAKQLRYAMEVFGDCFDKEFKESAYPTVEQMQECLGNLHDSDIAIRRLEHWRDSISARLSGDWPRYKTGLEKLIEEFRKNIATQRRKFGTCWRRWLKVDPAAHLKEWQANAQCGELVSMAGKDKTAPAGLDGLRSGPGQETVPAGGLP